MSRHEVKKRARIASCSSKNVRLRTMRKWSRKFDPRTYQRLKKRLRYEMENQK